jgi:hypothetical protein
MSDRNERTNPQLNCTLSAGLWAILHEHSRKTNEPVSHIVSRALAEYLQVSHSTLYQVSTATALVEGIYQGAVRVRTLREHGDLGLGTFENLDGEMVIVDGRFFQARSDGSVAEVDDNVLAPFAVITRLHRIQRSSCSGVLTSASDCASGRPAGRYRQFLQSIRRVGWRYCLDASASDSSRFSVSSRIIGQAIA